MNSDKMKNARTAGAAARDSRIDGDTSPEAIERQIDERRARIDRQLGELEDRISPRQLIDQGMDLFRNQGGDVVNSLGRSFRDNPAPFIVAGVGLAWLMASTSRSSRDSYYAYDDSSSRGDPDRYDSHQRLSAKWSNSDGSDYRFGGASGADLDCGDRQESDEGMLDKAGNVIDDLGDRASDFAESASEKVGRARERGAEHTRRMQHDARYRMQQMRASGRDVGNRARRGAGEVSQYFQEQPLIGGLLGLAAGAALGSLLPPSQIEDDMMGEQSDRLTREAAERAGEGAERAREKVESVASDVKQAADSEIDKRSKSTLGTGEVEPA